MFRGSKLFIVGCRVFTGAVFVYSGFQKLVMPIEEFQRQIEAYQFFPAMAIPLIARTVPWVELVGGAFFFLGFLRRASAFTLGCLSFSFIALLSFTLIQGIELGNCGCFGEGIRLSVKQALLLDGCLATILTYLFFHRPQYAELDQWIERGRS